MKNILLKLIFILAMTFWTSSVSKAQLVYIPDSAFRVYLNQIFGTCMVGDSIDPTCPAILATKYNDVSNRGISDLTGIEVFVNDTLLDCNSNPIISLPVLPSNLRRLYCSGNQL